MYITRSCLLRADKIFRTKIIELCERKQVLCREGRPFAQRCRRKYRSVGNRWKIGSGFESQKSPGCGKHPSSPAKNFAGNPRGYRILKRFPNSRSFIGSLYRVSKKQMDSFRYSRATLPCFENGKHDSYISSRKFSRFGTKTATFPA